ncbi:hypothetical protein BDW75DRAFT_238267 [Aspergillus navahoensis]
MAAIPDNQPVVSCPATWSGIFRLSRGRPKYAALSRWHEVYHDIYLQGKLIFWIEEQHKKYDLWETIYAKAGRVDNLHRIRRGALNPFFSRQRILELQDIIRQKLNILIKRVDEYMALNAPAPINRGFMAFSEDGWAPTLHDPFVIVALAANTALHFPIIPKIMSALPEFWIERLDPVYAPIFRLQRDFGNQIRDIKESLAGRSPKLGKQTVFSDLIQGNLPASEKADRRLQDEASS